MTLDKVKVYLDGKMVVFATENDVLIASVPPGQFRIKPTDGDGFAFEDLVNNKTIAAVKDYDDVLDAAGATYGANQAAVLTALNAFAGFNQGGGGADVVFQEQDITQDTTQAIYFTRHSFSGELAAGTYQIDSYQYLEILTANGEIRNGIFIDTVLTSDIRATYTLTEPKPLLNRYIYVHGGGSVQIDSAFRRSAAGTSATCTFSNLIIKKIA